MSKRIVNITEVCNEIFAGGDAPKNRMSLQKTPQYTIPIYSNGEVNDGLYGYTDFARVTSPSITISARGTIGYASIRNEPFVPIVRLITITPKTEIIDINYLYYAVKNIKLSGSGTSIPQLTVPMLKKYDFPLLPLNEQSKVAMILGKVDSLISIRHQQLVTLDELVKARFVEMFGDPLSDKSEWEKSTIGSCFSVTSGGTPSTKEKAYWDEGTIPWIGSNMCQDTILYANDGKFITEEGYANSSVKWVNKGSVLVALVGATIGKTALLRFNTTTNQNIAAIDVNNNPKFSSEFVFFHLQMQYNKFLEIGSGKFKMANQSFIRQLPLICPPLKLQEKFAAFVQTTDQTKSTIQASLDELETLKKSLMQEYFG